jgi:hypothetical protein
VTGVFAHSGYAVTQNNVSLAVLLVLLLSFPLAESAIRYSEMGVGGGTSGNHTPSWVLLFLFSLFLGPSS